jgi:hypothetical protein
MSIKEERVRELLAACLEIETSDLPEQATRETTAGWDSVVHLSLLGMLEDESPGLLDRFPRLAESMSIAEIVAIVAADDF